MSELAQQVLADIVESENEEWMLASSKIEAEIGVWPVKLKAIAESAFKAGMGSGALWVIRYLHEKGMLPK